MELYNPNSQAIDLSGWTIAGGIDLTVQPGTVILPRSTMTFASNDPGFRAAYSPTVFVGDRYTGDLAASEALTLTRPDSSVADTLTYGGAGWPVPTSGQSLELTDLAADNSVGTNWALSTGSGTPGTTAGGPVITAPGAPTIGTATAGNATATVRWTAPTDDGGSGISGYSIQVLDNTETQVGALRTAAAGATSLVVTGLTNGTAYHFQVAATNTAGTGAYSASSNTVTPAATTVPGATRHRGPQPGRRRRITHRHRPLDPTSQHRRLRHHRLPGHRPTDELQRRRRHRPVHAPTHPSSEPRSANAPSPSPPATTASKSSPSTPSAPAHPQPAPPTSSLADPTGQRGVEKPPWRTGRSNTRPGNDMSSHRSKLAGLLATTLTLSAAVAVTTAAPAQAAATDVVINEMMFHALSDLDGDDYLELYNLGTTPSTCPGGPSAASP